MESHDRRAAREIDWQSTRCLWAIMHGATVVGHVPRKVSAAFFARDITGRSFLWKNLYSAMVLLKCADTHPKRIAHAHGRIDWRFFNLAVDSSITKSLN